MKEAILGRGLTQTERRVSYFICTEQKSVFPFAVPAFESEDLDKSRLTELHPEDIDVASSERGPLR